MESSVDSLLHSFRRVTPAGIPAMLDCIIALTASSPAQLVSPLLDVFSQIKKVIKDPILLHYRNLIRLHKIKEVVFVLKTMFFFFFLYNGL